MAEQAEPRGRWFKKALPLFEALVVSFTFEAFRAIAEKDGEALQRLMTSSAPYVRWLGSLLQQEGFALPPRRALATGRRQQPARRRGHLAHARARAHFDALPHLVLLGRGRAGHLPHLLLNPSERPAFLDALCRSPVAEMFIRTTSPMPACDRRSSSSSPIWPVTGRCTAAFTSWETLIRPSEVPRALLAALPEDRLDYVLALPEAVAERQRAEYAHAPNLVVATLDATSWQLAAEMRCCR